MLAFAKVNSLCWHLSSVPNYNLFLLNGRYEKPRGIIIEGIGFKLANILFPNSVKPNVLVSDQLRSGSRTFWLSQFLGTAHLAQDLETCHFAIYFKREMHFNQSNRLLLDSLFKCKKKRGSFSLISNSRLMVEWDGHTVPFISGHDRHKMFINVCGSDVLDCWETLQESGVSFQPHAAVLYGETWGNFIDSITHVGHSCLWKTHQFKGALYEQEGYTAVEWYTRC